MAKKKTTLLDIQAAFEKQESCPDCGAEWTEMVNEKGKLIKGRGLVLVHGEKCIAYSGPSTVGEGNDE